MTHDDVIRTAIADLVVDAIDAGGWPGTLEFQDAASAVVAFLTFGEPAFGPAVDGVAEANEIDPDVESGAGTITKAVIKDSLGAVILTATVSEPEGGGDIELGSVVVSEGQVVSLTSLTYTAPV